MQPRFEQLHSEYKYDTIKFIKYRIYKILEEKKYIIIINRNL